MTPDIKTPKWWSQHWNQRLNVLLRFAHVDPWTLNDDALEKLRADIAFAVIGLPIGPQRGEPFEPFNRMATREALRQAQRGLDRALKLLLVAGRGLPKTAEFKLAKSTLRIYVTEAHGYFHGFESEHLATLVYVTLAELLKESNVKPSEILHCSLCDTLFVPLRKPRKGLPIYCSHRCGSVIASRAFRKRQAEARLKKRGQSAVNVMKSRGKL
jgi:hypothetical protein